jgi:hypothetical protein
MDKDSKYFIGLLLLMIICITGVFLIIYGSLFINKPYKCPYRSNLTYSANKCYYINNTSVDQIYDQEAYNNGLIMIITGSLLSVLVIGISLKIHIKRKQIVMPDSVMPNSIVV